MAVVELHPESKRPHAPQRSKGGPAMPSRAATAAMQVSGAKVTPGTHHHTQPPAAGWAKRRGQPGRPQPRQRMPTPRWSPRPSALAALRHEPALGHQHAPSLRASDGYWGGQQGEGRGEAPSDGGSGAAVTDNLQECEGDRGGSGLPRATREQR